VFRKLIYHAIRKKKKPVRAFFSATKNYTQELLRESGISGYLK
jgi:hypothetical protein